MITIAREDQLEMLAEELRRAREFVPSIHAIKPASALKRVPVLRPDYIAGAIIEPDSLELDVNALHQGFLAKAKARGARIMTDAGVEAIEHRDGYWRVETKVGRFGGQSIVNAAGAWADTIAAMSGVEPIGLEPRRRTAFTISAPGGMIISDWPLINDVGEEFYFKPDAGQIFVSPADATPSEPMDAYAEEIDIAIGADRLQQATTLSVQTVSHSWAGLRTFAVDGSPVVGADEAAEGFYWLAGQGGYGIKTSPALSRACADLIRYQRLPDDLVRLGIEAADLAPARFRSRRATLSIHQAQTGSNA